MRFATPIVRGKLLRRYKRFLADVELDDGRVVTAHCANSGSMSSCYLPGSLVWLTERDDPKRKLKFDWQVSTVGDARIFVHPIFSNRIAKEAIESGVIAELRDYAHIQTEPRVSSHTRLDLLLTRGTERCFVEVKSATLLLDQGRIAFPDAVSERGTKHLRELVTQVENGHRGVLLFCANRTDARSVEPADLIDPVYGRTLRWAAARGVEILAYRVSVSQARVVLTRRIPVLLDPPAVTAPRKPKSRTVVALQRR